MWITMNQDTESNIINKKIIIRPLSKDDYRILKEFFSEITEKDKYYFHPHPFDTVTIRKLIKDIDNRNVFRALMTTKMNRNELAIGYGFLWELNKEKPSLGIYIRNKYQERKLGSLMMKYLVDIAKHFKKNGIALTVYRDNKRAYNLYKKIGFKVRRVVLNMELDFTNE